MAVWNYVLNEKFVAEAGPEGVARLVRAIGEAAGQVRAGDLEHAVSILTDRFAADGVELPKKSIDQLAENLTMDEHEGVTISDESGHVYATFELPESTVDEVQFLNHAAPDDPDRPALS